MPPKPGLIQEKSHKIDQYVDIEYFIKKRYTRRTMIVKRNFLGYFLVIV